MLRRLPFQIKRSSIATTTLSDKDTHTQIKYHWIDGVESLSLYQAGGYHPVTVGSVLLDRYHIVDKLGSGGYSTVWLARDEAERRFVAVKVGIADQSSAYRESRIIHKISQGPTQHLSLIPKILDEFEIHGPNGRHPCYTTNPAQSDLKTASFSRLFNIRVARALSANLVLAVARVHAHGYVHGDIRLRNVLSRLPPEFDSLSVDEFRSRFGEPEIYDITRLDGKPLTNNVPARAVVPVDLGKPAQEFTLADAHNLLLVDFGESFAPAEESRLGSSCHCPVATRPPEALFEPEQPLSFSSDIWSLALGIWDIIGMKFLFSESEPKFTVAAQQVDVLGSDSFPTEWWERWEDLDKYFPNKTDHNMAMNEHGRDIWPTLENAFEEFVQLYRRERKTMGEFEEDEAHAFLELMRQMLRFRPKERLTAEGVLRSKWMVQWALPELKRSQKPAHP